LQRGVGRVSKSYSLFWLAACFVFALDRVTKRWAEHSLRLEESQPGIDGWYQWTLHYNPGAMGGILSGQIGFLILISCLTVAFILWFVHKGPHNRNLWLMIGFGLMIGGALGNLFDRVLYHHVIDFIHPVGETYIYNIADKGIRWGLYLGLFGLWKSNRRLAKEKQNMVL